MVEVVEEVADSGVGGDSKNGGKRISAPLPQNCPRNSCLKLVLWPILRSPSELNTRYSDVPNKRLALIKDAVRKYHPIPKRSTYKERCTCPDGKLTSKDPC